MTWVTILWSMDAAVCLTLGGMSLLIWFKQRGNWICLLFTCAAVAAGFEASVVLIDASIPSPNQALERTDSAEGCHIPSPRLSPLRGSLGLGPAF